jgi:hypothetical protein
LEYWHRFITFLDYYALYWKSLPPEVAFHQQRNLFISGAKPTAFYKLLAQEKLTLTSLDKLRKAVKTIVNFASLNRSTFEQNSSSLTSDDAGSSPQKNFPDSGSNSKTHLSQYHKQSGGQHQISVRSVKASSYPADFAHEEVSILDSSSSVHCVLSNSHLIPSSIDTDIQPLALTAANDSTISIISKGQRNLAHFITLSDTFVTPSIPQFIVSPQLLIQENNASFLFHHSSVYLLANSYFESINHDVINNQNSLLFAELDPSDNLYKIFTPIQPSIPSESPLSNSVSTIRSYATVNFTNIADTVNFWHCALGHPDAADITINVFDANPSIRDLIPLVTAANIRKFFPTCLLLFLSLMTPLDRLFELDFKGKSTDAAGKLQGHLNTFTAVDASTRFIFAKLAKSRLSVVDNLGALRISVLNSNKTLRVIRTDNEFVTSLSKTSAKYHNIQLQPSIPFAHNTLRHVERLHRTLQEMVVKALSNKTHLSAQFWGLPYIRRSSP